MRHFPPFYQQQPLSLFGAHGSAPVPGIITRYFADGSRHILPDDPDHAALVFYRSALRPTVFQRWLEEVREEVKEYCARWKYLKKTEQMPFQSQPDWRAFGFAALDSHANPIACFLRTLKPRDIRAEPGRLLLVEPDGQAAACSAPMWMSRYLAALARRFPHGQVSIEEAFAVLTGMQEQQEEQEPGYSYADSLLSGPASLPAPEASFREAIEEHWPEARLCQEVLSLLATPGKLLQYLEGAAQCRDVFGLSPDLNPATLFLTAKIGSGARAIAWLNGIFLLAPKPLAFTSPAWPERVLWAPLPEWLTAFITRLNAERRGRRAFLSAEEAARLLRAVVQASLSEREPAPAPTERERTAKKRTTTLKPSRLSAC